MGEWYLVSDGFGQAFLGPCSHINVINAFRTFTSHVGTPASGWHTECA